MSDEKPPCCAPPRNLETGDFEHPTEAMPLPVVNASPRTIHLVALPGGRTVLGDDGPLSYQADGEARFTADVAPFELAPTCVSNVDFAEFVDATNYVTDAEQFGWSFVFGPLLPDDVPATAGVVGAQWWRQVFRATWRHPEGPGSTVESRRNHPVVHVSQRDALAYAAWSGTRLCTEAEWEYAARAGTSTTWPWGEEREPDGRHQMNVFQGNFPLTNTAADGFVSTCPVDAFPPNHFGLWNMIGNVWEWTNESFVPPHRNVPVTGDSPVLLKGGSFLCHESYCHRYRPGARMGSTADSTASNIGFRIAR
jgi:formylglycine-generating enzyme